MKKHTRACKWEYKKSNNTIKWLIFYITCVCLSAEWKRHKGRRSGSQWRMKKSVKWSNKVVVSSRKDYTTTRRKGGVFQSSYLCRVCTDYSTLLSELDSCPRRELKTWSRVAFLFPSLLFQTQFYRRTFNFVRFFNSFHYFICKDRLNLKKSNL